MADSVSQSSVDSTGEFVVVNREPKLRLPDCDNLHDLERKMSELINEEGKSSDKDSTPSPRPVSKDPSPEPDSPCDNNEPTPTGGDAEKNLPVTEVQKDIGQSKFYSAEIRRPRSLTSPTKTDQDFGDPWRLRSESVPAIAKLPPGKCTFFNGITYLGSASLNAPRSEREISRNMKVLNENSQMTIPITLSIPNSSQGILRLLEPTSGNEISYYRINRVLFCARGSVDSNDKMCFAFTCSHGDSPQSVMFQCHVFRCDIHEAIGKILYCFATSFRKIPRGSIASTLENNVFQFDVSLEFKEDDGKGGYVTCPKEKNSSVFKIRCNLEKRIVMTVQQLSNADLKIDRCFGMLLCPGRNVKHSDMHLLDMVSMGASPDGKSYLISGEWNPNDANFRILNAETPRDTRVFLTTAVDLVIDGIQEPVRFQVETRAKVFPQTERFWVFNKRPQHEIFNLILEEVDTEDGSTTFKVISLESHTEIERKKQAMRLNLSPSPPRSIGDVTTPNGDDSDDLDEALPSGSGMVSKEITDEELIAQWDETLKKWRLNFSQRPKTVLPLCRKGVPEALRGEVWQLLAGCHDNSEMMEAYRILITKESPTESVIQRDINRTFPGHEYFKDSGTGQDSLFKLCKAYAIYDDEVGYVQGITFLGAALLLHMPEEQAFAVLVKVMFEYGMREMFRQDFELLHLQFFQLERLIQDHLPDLYGHFLDLGLEAHMYASQWFLTLFTAKFPLYMVFHILDIFLCEGMNVVFNVALALLKRNRKDVLALDFEGVLKYFRVQLPKQHRSEVNTHELLQTAVSLKVSSKKLKKYEKEYIALKQAQLQDEDPLERYERENKRLMDTNMRLEQENDDLAHELVSSKISLRGDLDTVEDKAETLNKELLTTSKSLTEISEEKLRLESEATKLKEMCRRELEKAEQDGQRNNAIIAEYKTICTQLSERLEKQSTHHKEELARIKTQIQKCDNCSKLVNESGQFKSVQLAEEDLSPEILDMQRQLRELELELAQTKLALVETQCRSQDLTHQLNSAVTEAQASKNTWFHKTLSSIREATNKKE